MKSEKMNLRYSKLSVSPNNPRRVFNPVELKALAASIRTIGIVNPLLVRSGDSNGDTYEIIDGERRYRAAAIAGIKDTDAIPCLIVSASDKEAKILRLVTDSHVPLNQIELSHALAKLLCIGSDITQNDLAKMIGKDKSQVSRLMKLCALPNEVHDLFISCTDTTGGETLRPLTPKHAQHLLRLHCNMELGFSGEIALVELAKKAYNGGWSTRKLEAEVNKVLNPIKKTQAEPSAILQALNDCISEEFGGRVKFKSKKDGAFSFTGVGANFTELTDVVYKLFGKVLTDDGELVDAGEEDHKTTMHAAEEPQ